MDLANSDELPVMQTRSDDYKRLLFSFFTLHSNGSGYWKLVVSVAQLVARWTHDRKVVGSIPTNAVCFTVVR